MGPVNYTLQADEHPLENKALAIAVQTNATGMAATARHKLPAAVVVLEVLVRSSGHGRLVHPHLSINICPHTQLQINPILSETSDVDSHGTVNQMSRRPAASYPHAGSELSPPVLSRIHHGCAGSHQKWLI